MTRWQPIRTFRQDMQVEPNQRDYWCTYYGSHEAPVLPSQFALFIANEIQTGELPQAGTILDIGCGNGRDALFFLGMGYQVRGLDQSGAAIEACRERLDDYTGDIRKRAAFVEGAADSPASWDWLAQEVTGPVLVYARFFFHAVDQAAEAGVLAQIAKLLSQRGGALCAEFRTSKDIGNTKATPCHYRRFIDPDVFALGVERVGMRVVWQAEGQGMAKYLQDDAYVARVIAQRPNPASPGAMP